MLQNISFAFKDIYAAITFASFVTNLRVLRRISPVEFVFIIAKAFEVFNKSSIVWGFFNFIPQNYSINFLFHSKHFGMIRSSQLCLQTRISIFILFFLQSVLLSPPPMALHFSPAYPRSSLCRTSKEKRDSNINFTPAFHLQPEV